MVCFFRYNDIISGITSQNDDDFKILVNIRLTFNVYAMYKFFISFLDHVFILLS